MTSAATELSATGATYSARGEFIMGCRVMPGKDEWMVARGGA
jgi:hypothetical protein